MRLRSKSHDTSNRYPLAPSRLSFRKHEVCRPMVRWSVDSDRRGLNRPHLAEAAGCRHGQRALWLGPRHSLPAADPKGYLSEWDDPRGRCRWSDRQSSSVDTGRHASVHRVRCCWTRSSFTAACLPYPMPDDINNLQHHLLVNSMAFARLAGTDAERRLESPHESWKPRISRGV